MMKILKRLRGDTRKKMRIKIVYKSGHTHEFLVYSFNYKKTYDGTITCEWEAVDPDNRPVVIGVDDIAAVWQLSA